MKFKIAVVQLETRQFSPEKNLKKAEKFIKKAATRRAGIIVFPEDFIFGPIEGKSELADAKNKYRKHFQDLAQKYKIDIVPGSIIEKDSFGLHNTAYYINSNGEIEAKYKKIHLWHPEKKYFAPGRKISVFDTKFGKIGLVICWDLIFPEVFRKMLKEGVRIIICPSYWCYGDAGNGLKYDEDSEIKLVDSLCIERAFENEVIIVYCNAAGKASLGKTPDTPIGHSQITAPFKGAIKKFNHNKEKMFVQEVDTAILKEAEKAYRIKNDLKGSLS